MAFTSAGQKKVKITQAVLADPKFASEDPDAIDVALELTEESTGESDWWNGELSHRYGVGKMAGIKQIDITVMSMEKAGWKHGRNITPETLKSLVGVDTEVGVKEREHDGITYFDAKYLGPSNFGPKVLKSEDAEARLKRLFGGGDDSEPTTGGDTAKPAANATASNPFA